MEKLLRQAEEDQQVPLLDRKALYEYVGVLGGTSTGSMVVASIAVGYDGMKILKGFLRGLPDVFAGRPPYDDYAFKRVLDGLFRSKALYSVSNR